MKPKDVPALVEALWRVQTAVHAIAARAASIPGLTVPEGWNPFARHRPARRPGPLAAPGRRGRRRLVALPRRAAPADRARACRRPGRAERSPGCGTRVVATARRSAGSSADQLVGLGRRRRLRAALVDDPPRARAWSSPALVSLRRWITFLDTLEPLRYAGLFDARRAAGYRRGPRPTTPSARSTAGWPTASVAERLDATGLDMFDAAGAREGDPPVHRRVARGARAPDGGAAGAGARRAAVRRGVRLGPGRRAAAGAGQAAPRARRAAAAGDRTAS